MGPVCARRAKAIAPSVHERDLFGYDTEKACAAACERNAVFIASLVAEASMAVRKRARLAKERLLGWEPRP
ncbi:hypothetical protein [Ramlibacter sp.]|uniref:hypothetical protein n=1 Tax=Ramlibacter sp. TaxID=1917967 RepID=UPI003D095A19